MPILPVSMAAELWCALLTIAFRRCVIFHSHWRGSIIDNGAKQGFTLDRREPG